MRLKGAVLQVFSPSQVAYLLLFPAPGEVLNVKGAKKWRDLPYETRGCNAAIK
jgi:hypothetical protein